MDIKRRKTRQIQVDNVKIGGDAPVVVQSITTTDTKNIDATVAQINSLEEAGCEVVRIAVPEAEAAEAAGEIKKQVKLPIVADVHYDHRLALMVMERGIDCIRINPGNIGSRQKVERPDAWRAVRD